MDVIFKEGKTLAIDSERIAKLASSIFYNSEIGYDRPEYHLTPDDFTVHRPSSLKDDIIEVFLQTSQHPGALFQVTWKVSLSESLENVTINVYQNTKTAKVQLLGETND